MIAPVAQPEDEIPKISARLLGAGAGWRVSNIQCQAGPHDRPFEESHRWVSVSIVLSGAFTYRSEHGRALMVPGSVLLGNQGACFCCSHEHGVGDRCLAFHFDPALMEEVASGIGNVRRITFARHRLPLLGNMVSLQADARRLLASGDPARAEDVALRMAGTALTLSSGQQYSRATSTDETRAASAVALIDAHYDQPLTLSWLAERIGLSRFHFLRVFRQTIGVTPYRYLLSRRLLAAADRLRDPNFSVTVAALDSGFADLSEFTRRFHASFGVTPSGYRAGRAASHSGANP